MELWKESSIEALINREEMIETGSSCTNEE